MIFPAELQRYIYILDDNPHAVEALVRHCVALQYLGLDIEKAFELGVVPTKLDKLG